MKRFLSLLIALLAITSTYADEYVTIDGIGYRIYTKEQTAEVSPNYSSGYSRYTGAIVIPSKVTYNGTDYPVTSIGNGCFKWSEVTSVTIPESVTHIGGWSFANCNALTSLTIPKSVTTIGDSCLYDSPNLKEVYCYATTPPAMSSMGGSTDLTNWPTGYFRITNDDNDKTLYVPSASVDAYKADTYWKVFKNILPIPTSTPAAAPSITYANKQLQFASSTEGAKFHYTITTDDAKTDAESEDGTINLAAAYNITAYATADGYTESDKTTATLYWVDGTLDPTNINNAKMRGILASSNDGIITISGLNDGEQVSLYTIDGKYICQIKAVNGVASYPVGNTSIVIAKVGNSSIKIAVK